jgi:hypothetical protein
MCWVREAGGEDGKGVDEFERWDDRPKLEWGEEETPA